MTDSGEPDPLEHLAELARDEPDIARDILGRMIADLAPDIGLASRLSLKALRLHACRRIMAREYVKDAEAGEVTAATLDHCDEFLRAYRSIRESATFEDEEVIRETVQTQAAGLFRAAKTETRTTTLKVVNYHVNLQELESGLEDIVLLLERDQPGRAFGLLGETRLRWMATLGRVYGPKVADIDPEILRPILDLPLRSDLGVIRSVFLHHEPALGFSIGLLDDPSLDGPGTIGESVVEWVYVRQRNGRWAVGPLATTGQS